MSSPTNTFRTLLRPLGFPAPSEEWPSSFYTAADDGWRPSNRVLLKPELEQWMFEVATTGLPDEMPMCFRWPLDTIRRMLPGSQADPTERNKVCALVEGTSKAMELDFERRIKVAMTKTSVTEVADLKLRESCMLLFAHSVKGMDAETAVSLESLCNLCKPNNNQDTFRLLARSICLGSVARDETCLLMGQMTMLGRFHGEDIAKLQNDLSRAEEEVRRLQSVTTGLLKAIQAENEAPAALRRHPTAASQTSNDPLASRSGHSAEEHSPSTSEGHYRAPMFMTGSSAATRLADSGHLLNGQEMAAAGYAWRLQGGDPGDRPAVSPADSAVRTTYRSGSDGASHPYIDRTPSGTL